MFLMHVVDLPCTQAPLYFVGKRRETGSSELGGLSPIPACEPSRNAWGAYTGGCYKQHTKKCLEMS